MMKNKERIVTVIISSLFFLALSASCSQHSDSEVCASILANLERQPVENMPGILSTALYNVLSKKPDYSNTQLIVYQILIITMAFNKQKYGVAQTLLHNLPNTLVAAEICLKNDAIVESSPELSDIKNKLKELFDVIHRNRLKSGNEILTTLPLSDSFIAWTKANELVHSRELDPGASMMLGHSTYITIPTQPQAELDDSQLPEIPLTRSGLKLLDSPPTLFGAPLIENYEPKNPLLRNTIQIKNDEYDFEHLKPDSKPAPVGYVASFCSLFSR